MDGYLIKRLLICEFELEKRKPNKKLWSSKIWINFFGTITQHIRIHTCVSKYGCYSIISVDMPEKIINLTSSEYEQWSLFTKSDTDTSHKYFRPSYFIFSVIILCVVEEKTYFFIQINAVDCAHWKWLRIFAWGQSFIL